LRFELKLNARTQSTEKAVLKENERGDCQVALLLGHRGKEMQPDTEVPWVLAADTCE
jgi:hypothetical protein